VSADPVPEPQDTDGNSGSPSVPETQRPRGRIVLVDRQPTIEWLAAETGGSELVE